MTTSIFEAIARNRDRVGTILGHMGDADGTRCLLLRNRSPSQSTDEDREAQNCEGHSQGGRRSPTSYHSTQTT